MKQSALKVSVIIPMFNEEKYIIDTLKGLLHQDYTNYEIIIVNNASTDASEILVNAFIAAHRQVPIILEYESQKGTNYARECARKLANGAIIAQLDSDCVPDYQWISKGVAYLTKYKNLAAVTGPYFYYDAPLPMRYFSLIGQTLTYPAITTATQIAKRGAILIGGNAFIFADILEKAGGYNTNLTFYGDDVDIAGRLANFGWVKYANNLILATSSRRYKALGFWNVNKKYQSFFWNLVFRKPIDLLETIELAHPR